MSFWSSLKSFFVPQKPDRAEMDRLRAKHGIVVDEAKNNGQKKEEKKEPYDPWEEVKNYRTNFFFGSFATRKFHIIDEEKVKQQLKELEKKRQEEEKNKGGEG
jgi:hypothetical protein